MKTIIINADDFGLTDGVSNGIIKLFEAQAISSTTIMVCVEGIEERCKYLASSGFSNVAGVHLQTTAESYHKKPLSSSSEIPTLVDSSGNFKTIDNQSEINPKEIELEWERQIVKASELLGHKPSHLDSHHGIHRIENLTPVYLKLAAKYEIPVRGGKYKGQIDTTRFGVKSSDISDSSWTGQNKSIDMFMKIVSEKFEEIPGGALEIVTHPGICDDELIKSSKWNKVRDHDYSVLLEMAKNKILKKEDIKLISFLDL